MIDFILSLFAVIFILCGAAYWLYRALLKAKTALFAARCAKDHSETRLKEVRQAARRTQDLCVQALANLDTVLVQNGEVISQNGEVISQAGQALHVAQQIATVGAEVHALYEQLAGPIVPDSPAAINGPYTRFDPIGNRHDAVPRLREVFA